MQTTPRVKNALLKTEASCTQEKRIKKGVRKNNIYKKGEIHL